MTHNVSPALLETYMRRAATLTREVVELPPFVLLFNPHDPLRFLNYARPMEPVTGDVAAPLAELRVASRT